ncbi:MAG: 3-dehydro-L-gulonate 2-dehydrogenase [Bacteroidetes bacterium]|nr:3-dehydro-L-gulonate 2-dehydrogenase [Bacteroidota bacterium]
MTVSFSELKETLKKVLLQLSFPQNKAEICADIFASNSRDGVHSHGLNRFPVFVDLVKKGLIDPMAEPECVEQNGLLEVWDGHLGAGTYNSSICMDRAIELAKKNSMSCVAIRNNNHWMRGGTYGWQAAEAGCIGICFTNASAGMPPWGGKEPRLGNNPLVIAVPHHEGHIVLDMAMSQFSYGKMQEYELKGRSLPFSGGYDREGNLSTDPVAIKQTKRALPAGFWKGSGLAMMMDILLAMLSGGRTTAKITASGNEYGLSQCFICIYKENLHQDLVDEIIAYTKTAIPVEAGTEIAYPGEQTLKRRIQSEKEGIIVDETMWKKVLSL